MGGKGWVARAPAPSAFVAGDAAEQLGYPRRMVRNSIVMLFALAMITTASFAAPDWNGTWAGNWQGGDGIQLIMAGNDPIGIYLHGDHLSEEFTGAIQGPIDSKWIEVDGQPVLGKRTGKLAR